MKKTAVRVGVPVVFAAVTTVVQAPSASALLTPTMHMTIHPGATSHQICVTGSTTALSLVANWELAVTGTRSNASVINEAVISSSQSINVCRNVPKQAAASGQYHVAFLFEGVGTEVFGKMTGFGSWQPALSDITAVLPA